MKLCPAFAVVVLASLASSCQRLETRDVWNVTFDLQIVSLPEDLALPLATDLRDPHRVEGAFKDLQKLIAEKRATLIGWPNVTTLSGQRVVAEQIEEFRYATEYDPPDNTTVTETPVASSKPGPGGETGPEQPAIVKTTTSMSNGMPAAFETRNVGVTFEAEPVVAPDGEMIELNMVPQHVRFLEWTKEVIIKEPPGVKVGVEQPRFCTFKITTSMTFHNGERKLIGFFKQPDAVGTVELFILRVDAVKKKVAASPLVAPSSSAPGVAPPLPGQ